MRNAESEAARISAITLILDRGYGKPAQAQHLSGAVGTYDLSKLSDDELECVDAILSRASIGGSSG
jgi:hypothetical protein